MYRLEKSREFFNKLLTIFYTQDCGWFCNSVLVEPSGREAKKQL